MTKATGKTSQKPAARFPFPEVAMPTFNGNLFSAYAHVSQTLLESAAALNQEIARFANERLEADAQLLQRLPRCTNWEDTVGVQTDFARAASEAYSAEIPKLMEKGSQCCAAALAPILASTTVVPKSDT